MYDELINKISYELVYDFLNFNNSIFSFCSAYAPAFSAFLGIMLGAKFLRDTFNSFN